MIYGILLVSIVLRLIKLDQSLWLDEAINVVNAKNFPFWDFVTKYPIGDFHPPAYFVLLWGWTHILGYGEIVVRLPSVVLGVGTIWVVYLLGKQLFDVKIALLASIFMALGPLHVYYSQEARMYSLALFSAATSFYFFWRLLNRMDKVNMLGYMGANALVLYSDYLPYLIFPAQFLFLIWSQREALKKILFLQVSSLIFLVPWLVIFPQQLSTGFRVAENVPGWASVVGGANLKELLLIPVKTMVGRVSIEDKFIYASILSVIAVVYGLVIGKGLKKLDKASKLLLLWLVVPTILAFLISFFVPVLSYFRMIFILPAFYLLLAKGTFSLPRKIIFPVISLICLISLISLTAYYINPKFQREDWKEAVSTMDQLADRGGVVLFENTNLPAPYVYYSQNTAPAWAGLLKVPAHSLVDVADLGSICEVKSVYLYEYLVDINDPQRLIEKKLQNRGCEKVKTYDFSGVGFVHQYVKAGRI